MKIIAHRGLWQDEKERNTLKALRSAVENGYGIETDLRDYGGELVISHDVATDNSVRAADFFRFYASTGKNVPLALNVKADGIQRMLGDLLREYRISDYFMFDMSIPEMVVYRREDFNFFTRHSDIEEECVLYQYASGVWLDSFFERDWLTEEIIRKHMADGKRICIISSEIHDYDETHMWEMLKRISDTNKIMLCTDRPNKAEDYFNGQG